MADRVVLARRTGGFAGFQWTGDEPESLHDVEVAEDLGATWEGDELVTYDLTLFTRGVELQGADTGYLSDND